MIDKTPKSSNAKNMLVLLIINHKKIDMLNKKNKKETVSQMDQFKGTLTEDELHVFNEVFWKNRIPNYKEIGFSKSTYYKVRDGLLKKAEEWFY